MFPWVIRNPCFYDWQLISSTLVLSLCMKATWGFIEMIKWVILSECIPCQARKTILYLLQSFLNNFLDFQKSTFVRGKRLEILSSIILPCGYVRSHKKCGPNRFSRFDVYWTQKHTHIPQTPRKAKYVYRNGLENNLRNLTLKEGSQGSLKTTSTVPLIPENYVCSPVNTWKLLL